MSITGSGSHSDSTCLLEVIEKIRLLKSDVSRIIEYNRNSKVICRLIMASTLRNGALQELSTCVPSPSVPREQFILGRNRLLRQRVWPTRGKVSPVTRVSGQATIRRDLAGFPLCHFLRHHQQEFSVTFTCPTQQPAEPSKRPCLAPRTAPAAFLYFRRRIRGLLSVVEKVIERDIHCTRYLFQRLDCWNTVAVLSARNVTAQESSALLDVSLGHLFLFAQSL